MKLSIYVTQEQLNIATCRSYSEHVSRLARIRSLPLSAFNYNPVYRIMLIWEAEVYINNVTKQLDAAFLN